MKKLVFLIIISVALLINDYAFSQCAVCRQSVESGVEAGQKQGSGLNSGILYLMSIPYVMGGVATYIWWKNRRKTTA